MADFTFKVNGVEIYTDHESLLAKEILGTGKREGCPFQEIQRITSCKMTKVGIEVTRLSIWRRINYSLPFPTCLHRWHNLFRYVR